MPLASSRDAARKRSASLPNSQPKTKRRTSHPETIKGSTLADPEKVARRRQSLSRQNSSNSLKENVGPGPTPYYQVRDGAVSQLESLGPMILSQYPVMLFFTGRGRAWWRNVSSHHSIGKEEQASTRRSQGRWPSFDILSSGSKEAGANACRKTTAVVSESTSHALLHIFQFISLIWTCYSFPQSRARRT